MRPQHFRRELINMELGDEKVYPKWKYPTELKWPEKGSEVKFNVGTEKREYYFEPELDQVTITRLE